MQKRLLLAISLCCIFFWRCDSESEIAPNSLIGISKENILRLVFTKCPKDANGEINIGIWEIKKNGKRSYQNLYYKSLKDAVNDPALMNNDNWEIAKKYKFYIRK